MGFGHDPSTAAPIVLVHGLMGFGRVRVAGITLANYFPGIAECLEAAGNRVLACPTSALRGAWPFVPANSRHSFNALAK